MMMMVISNKNEEMRLPKIWTQFGNSQTFSKIFSQFRQNFSIFNFWCENILRGICNFRRSSKFFLVLPFIEANFVLCYARHKKSRWCTKLPRRERRRGKERGRAREITEALVWEINCKLLRSAHVHARACVCVCVHACALTQCAKSGHCACSTHAKCGPLTKSGHTRGPLLALKLFLESFYIRIKVRSWLKSHTF